MFDQKDVVLIPFPYSDLTGSKQRPALIMSNTKLNKTEDRICCLITSNEPSDGIFIAKESFLEGKLPFKSWVKPYRLFTINTKIIKRKICKLNDEFHKKIINSINSYIKKQY